jgi:hypothetical protein
MIAELRLSFAVVEGEMFKNMRWGSDGTAQKLHCNKSSARWNSSK